MTGAGGGRSDVPYEHNAGHPYVWSARRGGEPYRIIEVRFSAAVEEPCDDWCNSPYSVQMINRGDVPWLRPSSWSSAPPVGPIAAGTTLREFVRIIIEGGGRCSPKCRPGPN